MCLPLTAYSQFTDDFSDGDFTGNPPWVGDHEKFRVSNGMLQLYDDAAGTAWLATESHVVHFTQWEFWVRLAFTPSDNNHARIYLVSNRSELDKPLNGYFLQIGKTGGDNKRLYFYRQDGEAIEELMAGSMNLATATNNIMRIRVTRDGFGNWQFLADPGNNHIFIVQGEAFDNTHTTTSWFGLKCKYTVSNSKRFYFDDFYVGAIIPEEPPQVEKVEVSSPNTLDINFSRMVSRETATAVTNYFVDGDVGHPLVVSYDEQQPNRVRLLFFSSFEENHVYTLQVSGVEAPDGQLMEDWSGTFVHYVSSRFDVVFNELMVNSRPVVGLPPHDWLELFNTTDLPVNLEGWVLQHGTTRRELPEAIIQPSGYLVLCTEAAYESLQDHGNVVAVPGLSANALTIGGTQLILWDDSDELVSFVSYNDGWYRDPAKTDGGWSLEKIDPLDLCRGAENWRASQDVSGGTPGNQNSVFGENPDLDKPYLLRAAVIDSINVSLTFSEPMDEELLHHAEHYTIDNDVGQPVSVHPVLPDFSRVDMVLPAPLQAGRIYVVEVSEHLADCAGNTMGARSARLALPANPKKQDIVINEVLFNPPDYGARYIELYNPSEQVFDLSDLIIASKDTIGEVLTTIRQISEEGLLFFPGDYMVLSNDTAAVKRTFLTPAPDAFTELAGMPRMTNSDGIVLLATKGHEVIDNFVYTEDMHLPLLASARGVALERLHPGLPTNDRSNWHSAAASVGYGTPGYRNSQQVTHPTGETAEFKIEPRIFAPDGSGVNDVLKIHYSLGEPGYVANVRIFDSRGRQVRQLVQGKLLAASGIITWDGTGDDRLKAAVGVYVVHVEIFNHRGDVKHYKLTAVLAASLK